MVAPILEMRNITKYYAERGKLANDGVSFSVEKGEIHCLAGENGAGKSTLMKILSGLETQDSGTIEVRGSIGMAYQHFLLIDDFSVAENIVMGKEPGKGLFFNAGAANRIAERIIKENGLTIRPASKVRELGVGEKEQVEIAKLLWRDSDILIFDEPTQALTKKECKAFYSIIRTLAGKGKTIIIITHKLSEILEIGDRVTILRHGKNVGTYNTDELDRRQLTFLLFGQEIDLAGLSKRLRQRKYPVGDKVVLSEAGIELREGEVLGITAVSSDSLRQMEEKIASLDSTVSYIPSDRVSKGCSLDATVCENLEIRNIERFCGKLGRVDRKKLNEDCALMLSEYAVDALPGDRMKTLSGGNMQRVVLARELSGANYSLFCEPTRGLDLEAGKMVYEVIAALRDSGHSVVLISSDLDEILTLSDRVMVLCKGKQVYNGSSDLSKAELGEYLLGEKRG